MIRILIPSCIFGGFSERLAAESEALSLHTEKQHLLGKVGDLEGEVKRLRKELEDEKESTGVSEVCDYA